MEQVEIFKEDTEKLEVDFNELEKIRKHIESLDSNHHVEIAKIFKKNKIKLTENNNGIFINLNNIDTKVINEIKKYLSFVSQQEKYINIHEDTKEKLENIYFKDNKDKSINIDEVEQEANV